MTGIEALITTLHSRSPEPDFMEIEEDRWLSAIFEHPVFRISIEPYHKQQKSNPSDLGELIKGHAHQQTRAMYYAKIETDRIDLSQGLSAAGLHVVDVNVTFGLDLNAQAHLPLMKGSEYSITETSPTDHEKVLDIAGSCFRYSRFHLDPAVPQKTAHQIKRQWIANYIRKERGESLWVAFKEEHPVGFLAVIASESNGKRIHTIDLVGVSTDFQRRGIGQALVAFFVEHYKGRSDFLQVGTQGANIPSLRLYQKAGFSVTRTQYVMHMHVLKERSDFPDANS